MAFNRRIMQKLEEACRGNEAMKGYMRDAAGCEFRGTKQYMKDYEGYLRKRSSEERKQHKS